MLLTATVKSWYLLLKWNSWWICEPYLDGTWPPPPWLDFPRRGVTDTPPKEAPHLRGCSRCGCCVCDLFLLPFLYPRAWLESPSSKEKTFMDFPAIKVRVPRKCILQEGLCSGFSVYFSPLGSDKAGNCSPWPLCHPQTPPFWACCCCSTFQLHPDPLGAAPGAASLTWGKGPGFQGSQREAEAAFPPGNNQELDTPECPACALAGEGARVTRLAFPDCRTAKTAWVCAWNHGIV